MFDSVRGAGAETWNLRALLCRDHFAPVTGRAIASLLHAAGELEAIDLLDVGCGGGEVVARANERGARALGIDVSPAMIELARRAHPSARFALGDAHDLDVADASCHVVTCTFALEHLAEPDRALAEMRRVLRPGGVLLCAIRCRPAPGDELVGALHDALHARGVMPDDPILDSRSAWRFADRAGTREALLDAGFDVPLFGDGATVWTGHGGTEVLRLLHGAFVRVSALLDAQPTSSRSTLEATIVSRIERLLYGGSIAVPWRWRLVRAHPARSSLRQSRPPERSNVIAFDRRPAE